MANGLRRSSHDDARPRPPLARVGAIRATFESPGFFLRLSVSRETRAMSTGWIVERGSIVVASTSTSSCRPRRRSSARFNSRGRNDASRSVVLARAEGKPAVDDGSSSRSMDEIWAAAHPKYLQKNAAEEAFCEDIDRADDEARRREALQIGVDGGEASESSSSSSLASSGGDSVWEAIREEARRDAAEEPMLSSYLYATILSHASLEQSLIFVLANKLADSTLLPTQLMEIFSDVLVEDKSEAGTTFREALREDIAAFKERDPACVGYSHALLLFKGFHALEAHRIQHALWNRGQDLMALALQSRISAVFSLDIHPAARLGKGILIDHGTGVVIGETCVIGDHVSILQGVTLGGTGKVNGDRHPKIGSHVLIGAHSTVLGNIQVGAGSMISAGSLVLKPVEPHTMVAGSPAKVIGKVRDTKPALLMDHHITPVAPTFCDDLEEAVRRQVDAENEKWRNLSAEKIKTHVISADEKRRRRRDGN